MSVNGVTPKKVKKLDRIAAEDGRDYDAETQQAMSDIDGCQESIDVLNGLASEEILKVEQKYNRLRKPHYEKREEIISKIPNFWVTALVNHPHIIPILNIDEEDCLYYLSKIEVDESEDIKSGYKINFFFRENPYFENEVLVKEHHLGVSGKITSSGTTIKWKEDHDFVAKANKCSLDKNKNRKRSGEIKSFFGWLVDHSNPAADDIAEVIKDEIWTNPLQYYLMSETVDDDDVENGDDSDEDEEEECEDEDIGEDGEGLVEEETEAEEEPGEYSCENGSVGND